GGAEEGGVGLDDTAQSRVLEEDLGDEDADDGAARGDAQPRGDVGQSAGEQDVADELVAGGLEGPGDLEEVGPGVADPVRGIDDHRDHGAEPDQEDPAGVVHPEPDDDQGDDDHARGGVDGVDVGLQNAAEDAA